MVVELAKYGMPPLVPLAVTASVPLVEIGEPATENTPGMVNPTDVTVPVPTKPEISAAVIARQVGVPLPPLGAIKT